MKNLTLAVLLLLCTCGRAQSLIDTSYNVNYPYTKKVLAIGAKSGASVDFVQIEEDGKEKKRFCRVNTSPIGSGKYYSAVLDKYQAVALSEKLNDLYVWAGTQNPNTYTERLDVLLGVVGRIEISMVAESKDSRFVLQLDADKWLNRGKIQIRRDDMPVVVNLVRECVDML